MASSPLLPSCTAFLIFLILTLFPPPAMASRVRAARLAQARSSSSLKQQAKSHRLQYLKVSSTLKSSNSLVMRKALMEGDDDVNDREDVVQSSPAQPSNFALAPLPEFPTLGPPIVWSFPAVPLPPLQAPPPADDMPKLPGTGSSNAGPAPAACNISYHRQPSPLVSPLVPVVAAEPAVSPGQLQVPELAPLPTAGGPLSPPY